MRTKGANGGWVKFTVTHEEFRHLRNIDLRIDKLLEKQIKAYESLSMWMPRWVREAIRTFRREGFAGMTLAEFLSAMVPDSEQSNKMNKGT